MSKILSFSSYLILGLVVSQFLPSFSGEHYDVIKMISSILLYVCLGFIMINVGREFTALSVGMFTKGEVGAGIIFIGISYNL